MKHNNTQNMAKLFTKVHNIWSGKIIYNKDEKHMISLHIKHMIMIFIKLRASGLKFI